MSASPADSDNPDFDWRHWLAPRWWPTWLALGLLWLLTRLPFDTALAVGRGIGRMAGKLLPARRHVVATNLALAFPEKTDQARNTLLRQSFEHVGMAAVEMGYSWFRDTRAFDVVRTDRAQGDVADARFIIDGAEHVEAALAAGHGMIFLQPHFTLLEFCAPLVGTQWTVDAVYDPPKNPMFAAFLLHQRCRFLNHLIDNRSVRQMVRILRQGGIVWFSPDQSVSPDHGGIDSRYFGQPALTSSGTARIVKMTGATILPFVPVRGERGQHYRFTFLPPVKIDCDDIVAGTQAVNDLLESLVRAHPEQYLWGHKRFKPPSADYPNPYRGRKA